MKARKFLKTMCGNYSLIVAIFFIGLSACDFTDKKTNTIKKTYPLHFSGAIMGTNYTIKTPFVPITLNKNTLQSDIKNLLDTVESIMSTYQTDSELSRFNSSQSLQWQAVSRPLFTVLKEAQRINKLTTGAFDITIGPIVNLWGFGVDTTAYNTPNTTLIETQLQKTGSDYLQLDETTQHIKKTIPSLYLDLSAIAKGYAVDQVAERLEQYGIADYMVEIGGELKLKGKSASNKHWQIAIEKPITTNRAIQKVLSLSDIALATSGDYRNYFKVDNVHFSHIIDPRTGNPITHQLTAITVLADTAMTADAMATALLVLGPEHGYYLAQKEGIEALFIIKNKQGFVEKASSAFIEKIETFQ